MATQFISRRALSAKERGRKGGLATASKSTPEILKARSTKAGEATKAKYGIGYYSYIQSLARSNRPLKQKITEDVLQIVAPSISTNTNNTTELMQAAAKAVVGV